MSLLDEVKRQESNFKYLEGITPAEVRTQLELLEKGRQIAMQALHESDDREVKLRDRITELEWFVAQVNQYLCPGEVDTKDAALIAMRKLEERVENLEEENAKIKSETTVPGLFRCAKCSFVLVSKTIYVQNGSIGPNDSPSECANGCGPMWRVSWKEETERHAQSADDLHVQIVKYQARISKLERVVEAARELCDDEDAAPITGGYTTKEIREALARLCAEEK